MKNLNKIGTLCAFLAVSGASLAPLTADAQRTRDRDDWRDRNQQEWRGRDDRRDRDNRRQGDRFGRYSRVDVDRLINRVERESNAFRSAFERAMRGGAIRDNDRNDDLKRDIQRLDETLERLRHDFDRSDSAREMRSRVSDVLAKARPVERAVNGRSRFEGAARRQWGAVRSGLNALASAFDLNRVQ